MSTPSWQAHLDAHRVFDAHVERLYPAPPREALLRAVHLREQLLRHIRYEEREVLPLLADEAVRDNVLRDHTMIREHLDRLEEATLLASFDRVDTRRWRQRLVELDRLLDHHDDREERDVYGPLGEASSPAERTALLAQLVEVRLDAPLDEAATARLLEHPTLGALSARYRAWLAGDPLRPATSDVPRDALPPAAATKLAKMLTRDDQLTSRSATGASLRETSRREHMADIALRTTLMRTLEAILP